MGIHITIDDEDIDTLGETFPKAEAPQSKAEPLISRATGKLIGCVQHDCEKCETDAEERRLLREIAEAAKGLAYGEDWNNGTHAKIYRPKLLAALRALVGSNGAGAERRPEGEE